jgi:hypothetical protein
MKVDKKQLKEIIKKEIKKQLSEKTIKTSGGLKVELKTKGGYELVRLHGFRGYVDIYGRSNIETFVRVLRKNFRIV